MSKKRCNMCIGSGTVMGGGMMMQECPNCDGSGKVYVEDEIKDLMKKESKEYKSAKDKIKALDDNMTEEEAEKLLDEELEKQQNVTRLKRRKAKE